ncbi:MAG: anti-sigma factor [Solirubrobacteraceae bacterium]
MSELPCEHSANAVGWVVGALSAEEAEGFAAHLAGCAKCRAQVARVTEAAEQLAEEPPLLTPPPELRERLMSSIQAETRLFNAARAEPRRSRPAQSLGRSQRAGGLLAVFASLAIVAAAIALLNANHGSRQVETRSVIGKVTSRGGGARARAVVQIEPQTATLILTRLTAPTAGQVYQAWVIRRDSPATPTGALFSVPRSGDARILLPALRNVTEVIVTAEPPRGSATPTLPPIVLVQLSARPGRMALKS